MDVGAIIIAVILAVNIFLAFWIFIKNPQNKINKLFFLAVFWIIIWSIANFLENRVTNKNLAILFLRIDFATATSLAYFFLLFCHNFPTPQKEKPFLWYFLAPLPIIILSILSFTDLIIYGFEFPLEGLTFKTGILFPLYAAYIAGYILIGGCGGLILKYRRLKGIERKQALYVLIGLSLMASIAVIANLFFTQIAGVAANVYGVGIYGQIFFVILTSYAITKHALFDIRVIATEVLVALIALGLLIDALMSKVLMEALFKSLIFVLASYGGYRLVLSVREEIKRRQEIQELTNQLKKANIRLQEFDQLKSEFLSMASHELNSPMAIILGYLHMILKEGFGKVDKTTKEVLEKVYGSASSLANLVRDLLNVSRIEQGRLVVEIQAFDPLPIIQEAVNNYQIKAQEKGLTLNYHPLISSLQVQADPERLKEVMNNLLSNAIKFTKQGYVKVEVRRQNSEMLTSIKDTGVGISKENQKHIFEKFYRTDNSWVREQGGTGLGLYITKGMIELMHGKIWFESEKEKGTTFYFTLPLAGAKIEIEKETEKEMPFGIGKGTLPSRFPLLSLILTSEIKKKLKKIEEKAGQFGLKGLSIYLVSGENLENSREKVSLKSRQSQVVKTAMNGKPYYQKEVAYLPLFVKNHLAGVLVLISEKDIEPEKEKYIPLVKETQKILKEVYEKEVARVMRNKV